MLKEHVPPKVRRQGRRLVRRSRRTISEHLFSSVGVCLGLGFCSGLLLGVALSDAVEGQKHRYGQELLDAVAHATPNWLGGK